MNDKKARLIREVEAHRATGYAWSLVLEAVLKGAREAGTEDALIREVFMEEIDRLTNLVNEMRNGAVESFGELMAMEAKQ